MSSSVEGWIVSPRKSRRKSPCFSRTTVGTPARANSSPSIIPAGPPPATQQRTDFVSPATRAPTRVSGEGESRRSEERRVGKEGRSRLGTHPQKKKGRRR